jgi:hypothetical protein
MFSPNSYTSISLITSISVVCLALIAIACNTSINWPATQLIVSAAAILGVIVLILALSMCFAARSAFTVLSLPHGRSR